MAYFNIGDNVTMYKKPESLDWNGIGKVDIHSNILNGQAFKIKCIGSKSGNDWIRLDMGDSSALALPACCFKLAEPDHSELLKEVARRFPSGCSYIDTDGHSRYDIEYDTTKYPAFYTSATYKKGDAIMIADGYGFVYENGNWANRIPGKKREHKFLVGDIIIGNKLATKNYGITQEGCTCEILKTYYDIDSDKKYITVKLISVKDKRDSSCIGDEFTVLEECFDLISKESPFHSQIKTNKDGKEHNNTDGVSLKVPRLDFKISRGNPIRGIGLNSSRSKVKLRSDSSYD